MLFLEQTGLARLTDHMLHSSVPMETKVIGGLRLDHSSMRTPEWRVMTNQVLSPHSLLPATPGGEDDNEQI